MQGANAPTGDWLIIVPYIYRKTSVSHYYLYIADPSCLPVRFAAIRRTTCGN